ncbi:MAG TPA: 23S rRNA (adenine(2503)-C(2))-methyltransferase RlmN [Candidatus Limnocylindrales bacterium]|nr:23S rRNA (adenine(2503)-C(2))-methyltransferase RlmN [Candidatus Limnocylindrales bacterium]
MTATEKPEPAASEDFVRDPLPDRPAPRAAQGTPQGVVPETAKRAVQATRRTNIRSLTLEEIGQWCEARGFPAYRASQLAGWLYNRPPCDVADMHNLPAVLRSALEEDFDVSRPSRALLRESNDGTRKLLVGLADERVVESVVIPRDQRTTLCISSQVGCALGCGYCATARLGLVRNLEPFEIVGQVMMGREVAAPELLTNYVFMGMGEPLANYDRLVRALEIMTSPWGLGISPRRITVSTVGLVPQLERLVRETDVHIAISLGSAIDDVRDGLMPINRRYPLSELIGACRRLELPRRKRITFEYTLLAGINDNLAAADAIVRLLAGLPVKLNLIPFNEWDGCEYRRPDDERVLAFQERVLASGIHTTVRASRGRDIQAACGQLAARGS